MRVYFASDHAGFAMKNAIVEFVRTLGYEVEDCGAHELDAADDYPPIIARAAQKVAHDFAERIDSRAIVFGGSGQGEAMVANRIKGIRAVVFYGNSTRTQTDLSHHTLDMLTSTREHNNANVLSLGVRFLNEEEMKSAVQKWLAAPFGGEERHTRRIAQIDRVIEA
ncbi:MAG: RpiB/LacA/LacB family sugar-phosphate isomerase [bacterium]|nr:RpiB/LacA/LacB family sugar-phosphate isomerase [bacterium]